MKEENNNLEANGQMRDYVQYIAELEEIIHHDKELRKIFGHETRNRLGIIKNFPDLIIQETNKINSNEPGTKERKERIIDYSWVIKRNITQLESIATILHLSSLRHKDLKSLSEQFNLEELVRENITNLDKEFDKHHLGIWYCYDRPNDEPIYVYSHKGFMNAMLNTIILNLIKHAPQYSSSMQGIKIEGENLVITTENLIGKSREEYGSRTGMGIRLLNLGAKQLKGELKLYISPSNKTYKFRELIGYKDAIKIEHYNTFGVSLSIPMKELIFEPPTKKSH